MESLDTNNTNIADGDTDDVRICLNDAETAELEKTSYY